MSGGSSAYGVRMAGHLRDLGQQIPLLATAALTISTFAAILAAYGVPISNPFDVVASGSLYLLSLIAMVLVDIVVILARKRPDRPAIFLVQRYLGPERTTRLIARIPLFIILILMMPIFGQMKSLIPLVRPFDWDHTLIAADRAIFGTDAWIAIQPFVGYPIVTAALAFLYHLWIFLIYPGTLFILLHSSCDRVRERYFLSYVLIWSVIGFGMAVSFTSVGPCFLQPILGDDHFAPLMTYLHAANEEYPVMVLKVQDLILEWYRTREFGLGSGISAMPSMHVAMAFLFYLGIRETSRMFGRVFLVFCALIWIGSVHLAYHYAIDGAVSIVATAAIWIVAKQVLDWWNRLLPSLGFASQGRIQTA